MRHDEKAALRRMRIEKMKDDAPSTGWFIQLMVVGILAAYLMR